MIPSTLENPTIIPSYQISSWDHFDPISYPSKYIMSISHLFKIQLSYLSKVRHVLIISSTLAVEVLIQFYYHSTWSCPKLSNQPSKPYSQISLIHIKSLAYLILSLCIEPFNLQMSWLSNSMYHQYILKSMCNMYYFE
jgi:hypothetical protein